MLLRDRMEKMINELLDGSIMLDEAVTEFEKVYIQMALARHSDHLSKTAVALGIHRNTLSKRIACYKESAKPARRKTNSHGKRISATKD